MTFLAFDPFHRPLTFKSHLFSVQILKMKLTTTLLIKLLTNSLKTHSMCILDELICIYPLEVFFVYEYDNLTEGCMPCYYLIELKLTLKIKVHLCSNEKQGRPPLSEVSFFFMMSVINSNCDLKTV